MTLYCKEMTPINKKKTTNNVRMRIAVFSSVMEISANKLTQRINTDKKLPKTKG